MKHTYINSKIVLVEVPTNKYASDKECIEDLSKKFGEVDCFCTAFTKDNANILLYLKQAQEPLGNLQEGEEKTFVTPEGDRFTAKKMVGDDGSTTLEVNNDGAVQDFDENSTEAQNLINTSQPVEML